MVILIFLGVAVLIVKLSKNPKHKEKVEKLSAKVVNATIRAFIGAHLNLCVSAALSIYPFVYFMVEHQWPTNGEDSSEDSANPDWMNISIGLVLALSTVALSGFIYYKFKKVEPSKFDEEKTKMKFGVLYNGVRTSDKTALMYVPLSFVKRLGIALVVINLEQFFAI